MKTLSSLFSIGAIILASVAHPVFAAGPGSYRPSGFEENKGQIRTTDGEAASFVKFHYAYNNAHIFLLKNGIAYQFERLHFPEGYEGTRIDAHRDPEQRDVLVGMHSEVRLETFRMDMVLVGADPDPRITTKGRSPDHMNYYTHDALRVHHFDEVIYHDVYPGIDWLIRTTEKGIKYDFIVHPGADPSMIKLKFTDHEELYVDAKGRLVHGNRLGRFTEQRPVSFQGDEEIGTAFDLKGDMLQFHIDRYDRTKTLVIDPDRIWGTYYGGSGFDDGWEVATDSLGNVYLAGSTSSTGVIASGGHQNIYGQNLDAFLVKFDPDGVRQWGTYYGGAQEDLGWSCAVDRSGNVYLSGSTASSSAIASAGHQNSFAGGLHDAFLVKFDPDGDRIWATYYGGAANDDGFHCTTDTMNNVYLSGETRSAEAIAFNGHLNTPPGIGDDNGFLVKFDSTGTRIWATYYGGDQLDNAQCAAVDLSGNVYLVGSTLSLAGIASGGHQNTHGGGSFDGYLVKFDTAGVRQWATYFGGESLDQGWSCAVDPEGNIYLAGLTFSTSSIASDGHQMTFGGAEDAMLAKFDSAGTLLWSTYYGGDLADEAYACATDGDGNVYLAGLAISESGIASGGHQIDQGSPGVADGFLAKFDAEGLRLWGTYYGGEASDVGYSCAADDLGSVYMVGLTYSTNAIGAEGHDNDFGGEFDAFLVKFEGGISTSIANDAVDGSEILGIHPNPIRRGSVISISGIPSGVISIQLIDALGRTVLFERRVMNGTVIELPVDASIAAGVYSVLIGTADDRVQGRIVIE